jgi:hypothetical protein
MATRPVRLAYQPPASSTFFLRTNQPAVLFSQNKSAPAISHQPNEQAACQMLMSRCRFNSCKDCKWSAANLTPGPDYYSSILSCIKKNLMNVYICPNESAGFRTVGAAHVCPVQRQRPLTSPVTTRAPRRKAAGRKARVARSGHRGRRGGVARAGISGEFTCVRRVSAAAPASTTCPPVVGPSRARAET